MNRELIEEVCVDVDNDIPHKMRLTYYLLTDSISDEHCDLKVYGAEIDKENIGQECGQREKKIIKDLFFRRSDAEEFLKKISAGTVTPMGLKYAVRDHINEKLKILACEG